MRVLPTGHKLLLDREEPLDDQSTPGGSMMFQIIGSVERKLRAANHRCKFRLIWSWPWWLSALLVDRTVDQAVRKSASGHLLECQYSNLGVFFRSHLWPEIQRSVIQGLFLHRSIEKAPTSSLLRIHACKKTWSILAQSSVITRQLLDVSLPLWYTHPFAQWLYLAMPTSIHRILPSRRILETYNYNHSSGTIFDFSSRSLLTKLCQQTIISTLQRSST